VSFFFRFLFSACTVTLAGPSAQPMVRLEEVRALAARNYPAGLEAEALARLGQAGISTARAWPDPALEVTFGRGKIADVGQEKSERSWQISQDIPSPIAYLYRIRSAESEAASLHAQGLSRQLDLVFLVDTTYYALAAAQEAVRVARESAADAEEVFRLISRRAELGESREAERLKAQIELLKQHRAAAAAQVEVEALSEALRRVAGPGLPDQFQAAVTWPARQAVPQLEAVERSLADGNPEILAARAEAEKLTQARKAAAWSRWPDLSVGAFREQEVDRKGRGVSLGLRLPLWNTGGPAVARAQAEESRAVAQLRRAEIDVRNELDRAYRFFAVAAEQARNYDRELLPAARESLRLSRLAFEEGEASLLDLLDAQRTYRESAREGLELKRSAALSYARISRLAGRLP